MESINSMKRTGATGKVNFPLSIINCQLSIILLLSLVFGGCKKEDDMGNQKADSFDGTVTAKVENGASYNSQISTVWALYDATVNSAGQLNGRSLTSGEYANGGFTLNLPEIPAAYLMNIQTFFTAVLNVSGELEYSDLDVQMLNAEFFGISSDNTYVDYFTYTTTGSNRTMCIFVYVDGEATVKGGNNINVVLRQGWNRIYWSSSKVNSTAPGGMKWYLKSDVN